MTKKIEVIAAHEKAAVEGGAHFFALQLDEALRAAESGDEILDLLERFAFAGLRRHFGLASEAPPSEVVDRWNAHRLVESPASPLPEEGLRASEVSEMRSLAGLGMQAVYVQECRKAIKANDLQLAVLNAAMAGYSGAVDTVSVRADRFSKALADRAHGRSGGTAKGSNARKRQEEDLAEFYRLQTKYPNWPLNDIYRTIAKKNQQPEKWKTLGRAIRKLRHSAPPTSGG